MGTRLYIGNLSFHTTEVDLRDAFTQAGLNAVEVKMMMDRETGRSRGFAFVEMGDQTAAAKAIDALHGRDLGGRALTVNEAREREPRAGGFGSRY